MRVLWFTNTASGYLERYQKKKTIGGGWFFSLENEILKRKDIKLGVAFLCSDSEEMEKVKDEKIIYYLVPDSKKTLYKKITDQCQNYSINEKNITNYLKVITDFNPDIIQIWGTERDYSLIIDKTDIPIVIHLQGIITPYSHKYFAAGISAFQTILYGGFINFIKQKNPVWSAYSFKRNSWREKEVLKKCKYIIGRTFWDKYITNTLAPQATYFHNDEMLRNIFYESKWRYRTNTKKILLTTSRGNFYKGFETILRTAKLLQNQINYEWKIIGIEETHNTIKIFEKLTGVKSDSIPITFLGTKHANELIEEMLNADVFIHPSHIDNSPNSVCEAMMIGMPVVATFAGGTGSLLTNEKEGLLVQDGDPYALSGAIIELLNKPEKAIQYGNMAKQKAQKRHSKDKIVNNLMNIYKTITEKNK